MRDEHGIQAEALAREFKGGIRAVCGIDLAVAPGEIYGFLGPNGAGKSTTVHMLTTLLPPSAGTARVAGFDVTTEGQQVRAAIGAALQEAARPAPHGARAPAPPDRAPRDAACRAQTAKPGAPRAGRAHGGRRPQGADVLRRDETPARPGARPRARSSILFLDEPTTGLDPQSRNALGRGSRGSPATRRHRLPHDAVPRGGRRARRLVGIIDHGTIVAEGTPAFLKAEIEAERRRSPPTRPSLPRWPRCSSTSASPCRARPRVMVRLDGGEE